MAEVGQLQFGRYRLTERLGGGSQGETWAATDEQQGDEVAIKLFSLADVTEWKSFDLFERECRVLRSLQHPSIPDYRDHGGDEARGLFFLAMQRVRGETLADGLAAGRRYTEPQLRALFDQLLAVLEYLHALRPAVIHRDLNPNNVIVDDQQRAWLVDFGGVREAFNDERASTIIGTHGYMAPEQLHGEAGPGSDLFSLGATVLAVATGAPAGDLPRQGLEVDLERVLPPGPLRDLLGWMLRPDPRQRATSATACRASLAAAAAGVQPSMSPPRSLPPGPHTSTAPAASPGPWTPIPAPNHSVASPGLPATTSPRAVQARSTPWSGKHNKAVVTAIGLFVVGSMFTSVFDVLMVLIHPLPLLFAGIAVVLVTSVWSSIARRRRNRR